MPSTIGIISLRNVKGACIVFMKEFAGDGQVGDPYKTGDVFYRYLVEKVFN